MVKALAKAFDESFYIDQCEENFKPEETKVLAEVAMLEIEAMAQAVVDGCVDFSKIVFGKPVKLQRSHGRDEEWELSYPTGPLRNPLILPEGNRLLSNREIES